MPASENITDSGRVRLRGLHERGDPHGEVRDAWHAKETLRSIYDTTDAEAGAATVEQLASDLQDPAPAPETNRLSRVRYGTANSGIANDRLGRGSKWYAALTSGSDGRLLRATWPAVGQAAVSRCVTESLFSCCRRRCDR